MKHILKNIVLIAIAICSCSKSEDAPTPEPPKPFSINTIAGSTEGDFDAVGTSAKISNAEHFVKDNQGNIYFLDYSNYKIKKLKPSGAVSTFAGSVYGDIDGTGTEAKFSYPTGIAIDKSGNIFFSDPNSYKVKKITPQGVVSTFAGDGTQGDLDVVAAVGSTAKTAKFWGIEGVAVDNVGNVYVCDSRNHKIKKITANGDSVTTFAGSKSGFLDATGTNAKFNEPTSIAIDKEDNLYVSDKRNPKIRKITPQGIVSTFAGSETGDLDGIGTSAKLNYPNNFTFNSQGELLFLDHTYSPVVIYKIKKVKPNGEVTTLFTATNQGDVDGTIEVAKIKSIETIITDAENNIIFSDADSKKIKKITFK
jgi:sugar lactone lactonase YvrE